MKITWDEDDPKNNYLTVFSWKSSRTKTFIIVSLVNTFATVFTRVNFAFVYVNFTMITTKSSRTFAFETTKCILNTTLWTDNFNFWEWPLCYPYYILRFWIECKNHEKSWKSRCNTKMESKVVLNKPLWYNSVTPPPRIQTTYYVVKAQSTNPDKNLIKEIYEKNRILWKFRNFGWYPGVWIADYVPNIGRHFDRERRHCPDHTRLCLNRSINSISKNFIPSNF